MHGDRLIYVVVALAIIGLWAGLAFLSHDARLRRRRRKSHSRVTSKSNRPMVRFSVRPPKD
ncbi:MAG TPA: hypothetical protein VG146_03690 [Verrucomicrobiae bacterium]|nr:hypothetical protein [Verrucomicrobiae bacterium]